MASPADIFVALDNPDEHRRRAPERVAGGALNSAVDCRSRIRPLRAQRGERLRSILAECYERRFER